MDRVEKGVATCLAQVQSRRHLVFDQYSVEKSGIILGYCWVFLLVDIKNARLANPYDCCLFGLFCSCKSFATM